MEYKPGKPISNIELSNNALIKNLCRHSYDVHTKQRISDYFRLFSPAAYSTARVIDCMSEKETNVIEHMYFDDLYEWYESEVYHFEYHNLQLNDDFIEYVLKK